RRRCLGLHGPYPAASPSLRQSTTLSVGFVRAEVRRPSSRHRRRRELEQSVTKGISVPDPEPRFSPIAEILDELRAGRMIILVDDKDRENEGDLVCAASLVTPEAINFMIRQAAGKLCLALAPEICDHLNLYPQSHENTAEHGTAFTVSIDAAAKFGVTSGV